jgi:hypothetical protein
MIKFARGLWLSDLDFTFFWSLYLRTVVTFKERVILYGDVGILSISALISGMCSSFETQAVMARYLPDVF